MKWVIKSINQWYIYHFTKRRNNMLTQYKKEIALILGCDFSCIEIHKVPTNFCITGKIIHKMEEFGYFKPDEHFFIGTFTVLRADKGKHHFISSFKLYQLPHCCAYMISCNVSVAIQHRRKGIGRILNRLREDIAKELGYSAIICTDVFNNMPQRLVLAKNGWSDAHSILNKRTGNKVMLSVKNLSHDKSHKSS